MLKRGTSDHSVQATSSDDIGFSGVIFSSAMVCPGSIADVTMFGDILDEDNDRLGQEITLRQPVSHRRHPFEHCERLIEVVPAKAAHGIGHGLRLVAPGIIEASGVDGEELRHEGEGQIDR